MTLPQGADYSLTESALIPFQAEPTHRSLLLLRFSLKHFNPEFER